MSKGKEGVSIAYQQKQIFSYEKQKLTQQAVGDGNVVVPSNQGS